MPFKRYFWAFSNILDFTNFNIIYHIDTYTYLPCRYICIHIKVMSIGVSLGTWILLYIWGHRQLCSLLTLISALQDLSWQCSGWHMEYRKWNRVQTFARQASFPLCYCFKKNVFILFVHFFFFTWAPLCSGINSW